MKNASMLLRTILFVTLFSSTIVFSQVKLASPEDVNTVEDKNDEVAYAIIETVPEFLACEGLTQNESKACFNKQIQKHIQKYLQYPTEAIELNAQGRVYVTFVIDKEGNVTDITARAPQIEGGEFLEKESIRILKALPKLKPGLLKGNPVKVRYTLPIAFKLDPEEEPIKK